MSKHEPNPLFPQYGCANQAPLEQALDEFEEIEASTLARRGRLYLLCSSTVDAGFPTQLVRAYYASIHYDPMHSLCQAIDSLVEESQASLPLVGALVHNMTLYSAGTGLGRGWIWRNNQLIPVLPDPRGEALGVPENTNLVKARPACVYSQRRLYPGDCIILTEASAERKMTARLIRRAAVMATNSDGFARTLAQLVRTSQHAHPLVSVIQLPGSAVTPQMPPQTQIEYTRGRSANTEERRSISPILVAAIVAAIAIAAAIMANKPQITGDMLRDLFVGTPQGTPSPDAGTGTPAATLEAATSTSALPAD